MRTHDFVSDGLLALIASSLVLLCSSLLVIAFSQPASSALRLFQ